MKRTNALPLAGVNSGEQSAAIELGGFNTIFEVEVTEERVSKAGGHARYPPPRTYELPILRRPPSC